MDTYGSNKSLFFQNVTNYKQQTIFATKCGKPFTLQTIYSVRSNNLNLEYKALHH